MNRDGDCYSPLKIFHHRGRLDALRLGERPDLLHVQLVLTNRCNQDCNFCAYRSHGYSSSEEFRAQDQMSTKDALQVVESCRALGVGAVEITGGGEPTLHPGLPDVCTALRDYGIDYSIVTNGSRASDEVFQALSGAKWVRFSLDAGRASTYAAIRRTQSSAMERARENIRTLWRMREDRSDPVIGVGFTVTEDNWHEVLMAAVNAKGDGADNFRVSAVFQNGGADYFRDFYEEARLLCRETEQLGDKTFRVFNMFGERIDDLLQRSPSETFCPIQHLVTYVGADLNVYRCCVYAYNERGLLGSLLNGRSLQDLWLSDEVGQKLWDLDARECSHCMFNRKNTTIRYALCESPTHVSFL